MFVPENTDGFAILSAVELPLMGEGYFANYGLVFGRKRKLLKI